jgi:FkbM family methyltransferase
MELGAGWGEWCIAATYWAKNVRRKTECVAVEALPQNYSQCLEHFDYNKLKGEVVKGAVSDYDGMAKFTLPINDKQPYGNGCENGRNLLSRMVYQLLCKITLVPCWSLKSLLTRYGHQDLVHMDIQGMEAKVIEAVMPTNLVDYWMIGTHSVKAHETTKEALKGCKIIVDCLPNRTSEVDYMMVQFQDGMIIAKRDK